MKVVVIVQARMGSSRFPGKVMREIVGRPMIGLLLERLSKSKTINSIALATSENNENKILASYVKSMGVTVFKGDELDVLDRYYKAALHLEADIVVRVTGDCPLIDPELVDDVVTTFLESSVDYVSNVSPPTFPDGLDVEVMSFGALEVAYRSAFQKKHREHVTSYLRESDSIAKINFANDIDLSHQRWTVDEVEDFEVVRAVFSHFYPRIDFTWKEVLDLSYTRPNIFLKNMNIGRNQGEKMNAGQKLWVRAKKVIPGGNSLLSKRAEMFLPNQWPAYFTKTSGCEVWDLENNKYIDMSIMGVGTNILGYSHPEVDEAVKAVVSSGNLSTFNCPEEVYLAERLVELHPWADMVRFARTGGEANAIAIRIARAASGKDGVAFCGYHGWHDWYLATNLEGKNTLSEHLLPGLSPNGVPEKLKGTIHPFSYNDFSQLENIVSSNDIGVIKMEVCRNKEPEDNFLHKVRQLATKNNIVLVFDECTSGFRQTFGGIHKQYGVDPDMAVFGKALGNGYAITAVIGRKEIMESAQTSFISSTFWTERIGPAAALKTLELMEKYQSWDIVTEAGIQIRKMWQSLADLYDLKITHWGIPSLAGFSFANKPLEYKTLITQEMLKEGYLAGNSVYVCMAHTPELIERFFNHLEPIFMLIKECENGRDINDLLDGPICHSGFARLN